METMKGESQRFVKCSFVGKHQVNIFFNEFHVKAPCDMAGCIGAQTTLFSPCALHDTALKNMMESFWGWKAQSETLVLRTIQGDIMGTSYKAIE